VRLRRPSPIEYRAGEFLSITERLVVAPAWGRFHGEPLEEGSGILKGSIIGRLTEGRRETVVVSPIRGVFLAWLVWEGERVPPGRPVARLRVAEV